MSDNEDEDTDLEIVPNSSIQASIVDLSSDNGDIPNAVIINDYNLHQNARSRRRSDNNKRKIKHEFHEHEPSTKRRRSSAHNNSDLIDGIKSEKQRSISVNMNKQSTKRATNTRRSGKTPRYKYYKLSSGMNYEGQCLNKECLVYKEQVIICRGFGAFEPIKDAQNKITRCPACANVFHLEFIILYKAKANIQYQLWRQTQITTQSASIRGSDYLTFGQKASSIASSKQNYNTSATQNRDTNRDYKTLRFDVEHHIK